MSVEEDLVPDVHPEELPTALPNIGRIPRDLPPAEVVARLQEASRLIRRQDIQMVHAAGLGHIGGEYSVIDILATLYLHVMDVDPARPADPFRDRFVLSKGHAAAALYTTLAAAGFMHSEQLASFMQPESQLNGHPARTKIAAVEASTGPLGHGFPIAVGMALSSRLTGAKNRVFVVLGDGELQEGSNWEALMSAAHHRLGNLTAVVDRNRLQQGDRVAETNDLEPLQDKFEAFGWRTWSVDGHDHAALLDVLDRAPDPDGRPTAVIANTYKGHPISFMSDDVAWHHKVPSEEQVKAALNELEAS